MISQSGGKLPGPPYPIRGAHVRKEETSTVVSIVSPDPNLIILWLARMVRDLGFEVLLDHDYGGDEPDDQAPDQVSRPPGRQD